MRSRQLRILRDRRLYRLWLLTSILLTVATKPASATGRIEVTQPTDFWVEFVSPVEFTAETFQSGDLPSDPQLWLYLEDGQLLVTVDDAVGLQSRINTSLPAGRYRLRAGTCCYEPDVWRDGQMWNVKYELTFTGQQIVEPSTTTTSTTSTTTTTEPATTTSTTTTTTTTEPATTTTIAPTTTTTEPATTTSTSTSTTTTTEPAPTTTLEMPPPATSSTTTTSSTTSTTTTTEVPPLVTVPIEDSVAPDSIPVEPTPEETPVEDDQILDLEAVSPADIAEQLNPSLLDELSDSQIETLVQDIAEAELTDEQAEAIAVALSDAPDAVKEMFEEQVDVFSGQFDAYVPLDSKVNVGERRVIIASTAAVLVLPAPASVSTSSNSKKGKQ